MAKKAQKAGKEKEERTIGDRNILKISVFKDEFEKFDITSETTYKEAVTKVREELDLPARFKMGGGVKGKIRDAMKEATPEKLQEISELLEISE